MFVSQTQSTQDMLGTSTSVAVVDALTVQETVAVAERAAARRLDAALADLERNADAFTAEELAALEADAVAGCLGTLDALDAGDSTVFGADAWALFADRARHNVLRRDRRARQGDRDVAWLQSVTVVGLDDAMFASVADDGDADTWAVREDLQAAYLL